MKISDKISLPPRTPWVTTSITLREIRGAVARGWCAPVNAAKVMDTDLAEAISQEVHKLFAAAHARWAKRKKKV